MKNGRAPIKELEAKGYLPPERAAAALMQNARDLAHGRQWVKYSLQVWFAEPTDEPPSDANESPR